MVTMRTHVLQSGEELHYVTNPEGYEMGFFTLPEALDTVSKWSRRSASIAA